MILSQESDKRLVFDKNILLVDLKVALWLLQVVHLRYQKVAGSCTDFEFEFLELGFDFN